MISEKIKGAHQKFDRASYQDMKKKLYLYLRTHNMQTL